MRGKLRQGLKSGSFAERDAIDAAQQLAVRLAIQADAAARCSVSDLGIADCTDLRAELLPSDWFRSGGHLWISISVNVKPSDHVYSFRWRVPVPYRPRRTAQRASTLNT